MNFEAVTLGDISWSQKDRSVWFHFYEVPKGVRFIGTEGRREDARGRGTGRGSNCLMGTVSVGESEKVLEVASGDGCTTMRTCFLNIFKKCLKC